MTAGVVSPARLFRPPLVPFAPKPPKTKGTTGREPDEKGRQSENPTYHKAHSSPT